MVLTNCPLCETELSKSAFSCPKCGHPLRKPERTVLGKVVKYLFIAFNVIMLAIFLVIFFDFFQENEGHGNIGEKAIFMGLGLYISAMIVMAWLPISIILGILTFLTRAKKQ
jgi:lipopolysaccharide export LptBFGC system permease protein LptF